MVISSTLQLTGTRCLVCRDAFWLTEEDKEGELVLCVQSPTERRSPGGRKAGAEEGRGLLALRSGWVFKS